MDHTQTIADIRRLQTELLDSVIERAEINARSIFSASRSRAAARTADFLAHAKRDAAALAKHLRAEAASAEVDAAFAIAAEQLRSMDETEQRHLLQRTLDSVSLSSWSKLSTAGSGGRARTRVKRTLPWLPRSIPSSRQAGLNLLASVIEHITPSRCN